MQAYGLQPENWSKSSLSIVVVGASGDLARKKIFPALFALYYESMLPEHFFVYGFSRTNFTDAEFRDTIVANLTCRLDHAYVVFVFVVVFLTGCCCCGLLLLCFYRVTWMVLCFVLTALVYALLWWVGDGGGGGGKHALCASTPQCVAAGATAVTSSMPFWSAASTLRCVGDALLCTAVAVTIAAKHAFV